MRSMRSKYSATVLQKYIGSYVAAMNGVDAIAVTAGIGENTNLVAERSLLTWLPRNHY